MLAKLLLVALFGLTSQVSFAESVCAKFPEVFSQHQKKNWESALAGYKKILEQDPSNVAANFCLAQTLHSTGRTEESLPHYEKAANLAEVREPKVSSYYGYTAKALYDLKRYESSLANCEKAIRICDCDRDVSSLRAHLLYKLDRLEDSENAYSALETKASLKGTEALEFAWVLRARKKFDAASRKALKAIELSPSDAILLYDVAKMLHRQGGVEKRAGDLEKARELYQAYYQLAPERNFEALNWRGGATEELSELKIPRQKKPMHEMLQGQWVSKTGLTRYFISASTYAFVEELSPVVTKKLGEKRGVSYPSFAWSAPRSFSYTVLQSNDDASSITIKLSAITTGSERTIKISANGNRLEMTSESPEGGTWTEIFYFENNTTEVGQSNLPILD